MKVNGSLAVDSYVKPIFNTFIRNYFNRLPPNDFFPVLSQKPDPLAETPLSRPDPSSAEIMSFVANRLRDMIVGEILSAEYEVVSNHKPPFRNMLEIFHIQVSENENKLLGVIFFKNKLLLQPNVVFDSESNGFNFSSIEPSGGK